MSNESAADPQDVSQDQAESEFQGDKPSHEGQKTEAEEAPLEELKGAPALEEEEDSLVNPESS